VTCAGIADSEYTSISNTYANWVCNSCLTREQHQQSIQYEMELWEKGSILGFHVESVEGQLQVTTEVFVVISVTNGTTNDVQA
jgi:hypothetical protein